MYNVIYQFHNNYYITRQLLNYFESKHVEMVQSFQVKSNSKSCILPLSVRYCLYRRSGNVLDLSLDLI
jgi:hemolysin activation/secretion protein